MSGFKAGIFITMFALSASLQAMPMITSVQEFKPPGSGDTGYEYQVGWNIGGFDVIKIPQLCLSIYYACAFGIIAQEANSKQFLYTSQPGQVDKFMLTYPTRFPFNGNWEDFRQGWITFHGVQGQTTLGASSFRDTKPNHQVSSFCFAIVFFNGQSGLPGYPVPSVQALLGCRDVQPAVPSCKATSTSIDHDRIKATEINGNRASGRLAIQCNLGPVDINAQLVGQDIQLQREQQNDTAGITSHIYYNNQDVAKGVLLQVPTSGALDVTLTSELSAPPNTPAGKYSGHGVIMLTYQ